MENKTKSKKDEKKVSNWKFFLTSFFAGAGAGALAKTAIAPLDRAKIHFQANAIRFKYTHAFTFLSESVKNDGFLSLWRGNSATMARIFPYSAIQYASQEQYKRLLKVNVSKESKHDNMRDHARRFLCGSLAGVTSVICTYPLDCLRARMAVTRKKRYATLWHAFRTVIREEGFVGLYRGFTPTVMGSIPYSGFAFFTFEIFVINFKYFNDRDTITIYERSFCGAIAGVVGQTSSYPLDIVRRRMQTGNVLGHPEYTENVWKTMKIIYEKEGFIRGLYKGLSMNWLKGPIASAISFTAFDILQKNFRALIT